jgi:hypothetical protein
MMDWNKLQNELFKNYIEEKYSKQITNTQLRLKK